MFDGAAPCTENGYGDALATLLAQSHSRLTGHELLADAGRGLGHALYHAPFAVLAHDRSVDPVFVYANLTAQRVFELPWERIVGMPSRFSAEPLAREERERLLERVTRDGYIDDYEGVRISSSGRRFRIAGAVVWNLATASGQLVGQAAAFSDYFDL